MRSLDQVLSRLQDVRKNGKGYRARCPACGGSSHKLTVAEGDDGRVLLHCFDCSDTRAVLEAIGLQWRDVFPPRTWPETAEERQRVRKALRETAWPAALTVLAREATIVHIAARTILGGVGLSEDDHARLQLAHNRIAKAREVLR